MFNKDSICDYYDLIKNKESLKGFCSFLTKRGTEFPPFIKNSGERPIIADDLSDDDFALIIKLGSEKIRKFPVDSPESTWFSQQSFLYNSNNLPISCIGNTSLILKRACDFYGLPSEKEIIERAAYSTSDSNVIDFDDPMVKRANEAVKPKDTFFALPSQEKYPLNTKREVSRAVSFFEENHKKMAMDKTAAEFAKNLKKGCIREKIEVPNLVWGFSDDCVTTNEEVLKLAFDRRIKNFKEHAPSENQVFTAKLAYESILNSFSCLRPLELINMIKKADEDILKLTNYKYELSPEQLVYEGHIFFPKLAENSVIDSLGNVGPNLNEDRIYSTGANGVLEQGKKERREKVKDVLLKYPDCLRGHLEDEKIDDLKSDFDLTYEHLSSYDRDLIFEITKRFE